MAQIIESDGHMLQAMRDEVEAYLEEKGWLNDGRSFGDELILIVSEVAEILEAYRDKAFKIWHTYKPVVNGVKLPKMTAEQCAVLGISTEGLTPIREGVAPELAGAFIRILDSCARHHVDLWSEWRQEMDYNWRRGYRHDGRAI